MKQEVRSSSASRMLPLALVRNGRMSKSSSAASPKTGRARTSSNGVRATSWRESGMPRSSSKENTQGLKPNTSSHPSCASAGGCRHLSLSGSIDPIQLQRCPSAIRHTVPPVFSGHQMSVGQCVVKSSSSLPSQGSESSSSLFSFLVRKKLNLTHSYIQLSLGCIAF